MRQLQVLQHQHLFPLGNVASRKGKHDGGIFFHPLTRLVNRGIQRLVLLVVLLLPAANSFLCRAFVFDSLKRGDIQGINGA